MTGLQFSEFKILDYKPFVMSRKPEVTIHTDHIVFNVAAMAEIGHPQYFRILIHPKGRGIALQSVKKPGKDTVNFPEGRKSKDFSIFQHDVVGNIRKMYSDWKENTRYKIPGEYLEEENAILFDSANSTPI